jgi:hypothetical protein
MLSIVAGGMETLNGQSEKNFPELRAQMEAEDPLYCTATSAAGEQTSMTHAECREKLTLELEDRIFLAAVVAVIVAVGLLVTIVLTLRGELNATLLTLPTYRCMCVRDCSLEICTLRCLVCCHTFALDLYLAFLLQQLFGR